MKICPTCKGTGKQTIRATTIDDRGVTKEPPMVITCILCKGAKEISEAEFASVERERELWCRCSKSKSGPFYDDGKHPGCVNKHHWHCVNCGKITQIG